jgi:hypothetical protein
LPEGALALPVERLETDESRPDEAGVVAERRGDDPDRLVATIRVALLFVIREVDTSAYIEQLISREKKWIFQQRSSQLSTTQTEQEE